MTFLMQIPLRDKLVANLKINEMDKTDLGYA